MIVDLIKEVNSASKVLNVTAQIEQIVAHAESLDDKQLVELLKGLQPRVVARIGELSPKLVERMIDIVEAQQATRVAKPDDNRFERIFSEDE